jgi:hypothetical protein
MRNAFELDMSGWIKVKPSSDDSLTKPINGATNGCGPTAGETVRPMFLLRGYPLCKNLHIDTLATIAV